MWCAVRSKAWRCAIAGCWSGSRNWFPRRGGSETIHIVGGGCQNTLLCQLAADACNRPVIAGPVEATAIGNVLVQAIGLGLIGSLAQGREVVRRSSRCERMSRNITTDGRSHIDVFWG